MAKIGPASEVGKEDRTNPREMKRKRRAIAEQRNVVQKECGCEGRRENDLLEIYAL